jgi:hypothetical protein
MIKLPSGSDRSVIAQNRFGLEELLKPPDTELTAITRLLVAAER